jgi:deoxyribose-phosphate aldolase
VCGVLQMGVDEIDMVVNVGKLKDQAFNYVLADIKAVVEATARFSSSLSLSLSPLCSALVFAPTRALTLTRMRLVAVCWRRSDGSQAVVKVILETGALTRDEIIDGCILSTLAGAQFVKTSTGFNAAAGGAKVEHVALMKKVVGDRLQVKVHMCTHTHTHEPSP